MSAEVPPTETPASPAEATDVSKEKTEEKKDVEIVLAGAPFKEGAELSRKMWDVVAKIEEAHKDSEEEELEFLLDSADQLLAFAILERHHSAEEKMQGGVRGIGWSITKQTFYVLHLDDSKTYFGISKAIEGVFAGTFVFKTVTAHEDAQRISYKRPVYTKGCLVKIEGLGEISPPEQLQMLKQHGVDFVHKNSTSEGLTARLENPEAAMKVLILKKRRKKNKTPSPQILEIDRVGDIEVTVTMVNSEEESKWYEVNGPEPKRFKGGKGWKGGKKGKGKGKKGGKGWKGGKGKKDEKNEESPAKDD